MENLTDSEEYDSELEDMLDSDYYPSESDEETDMDDDELTSESDLDSEDGYIEDWNEIEQKFEARRKIFEELFEPNEGLALPNYLDFEIDLDPALLDFEEEEHPAKKFKKDENL